MARNVSVTKSNNLIDASYRLNIQAQKLVLACLSKVDPRSEIPKEITITAKEYGDLMFVPNANRELYLAADTLFDSVIKIREDDGKERRIRWVQMDVKHHDGLGAVTLTWSDAVLRYISSLQRRFTTYRLDHVAKLQSTHSMRLYELLMRFKKTGDRVISIEDFKFALGITTEYQPFKFLNRDVIKPSVNEINTVSDLNIKYETIKKGRSVSYLSFEFKERSN